MNRTLLTAIFAIFSYALIGQNCNDLFFSTYLEGSNNNKAMEIYNPTPNAINLSAYQIGRFDNGTLTPSAGGGIQLPSVMLQPYDVFVVVLDRRDSLGVSFDLPSWNGYQVFTTAYDSVAMDTIRDIFGVPRLFVNYEHAVGDCRTLSANTTPFCYESTYKSAYDLQQHADLFACPDYNVNSSMSYNGDDAIYLIKGNDPLDPGAVFLDVVGVIGEDPGSAWETKTGKWITRDITIVRRSNIDVGTGLVASATGDTLDHSQWDFLERNDFSPLGSHSSVCDPNFSNSSQVGTVSFKAYPNPTTEGSLTIEAEELINGARIFDLSGKMVLQDVSISGSQKTQINVANLDNGFYTLVLDFIDGSSSATKIVRQ